MFQHIFSRLDPRPDLEDIWIRYNPDNSTLFLRLDKQNLIKNNQLRLTEGSDVLKITFKFNKQGYRNDFSSLLKEYLENQLQSAG